MRLLRAVVLTGLALLVSCGGGSTSSAPHGGGPVVLQSIKISPSSAAIAPKTTQAFTATGVYSDGSMKDLTLEVQWACPGTDAATISTLPPTQGLATALAPGTAVVTASLGNISNNAVLTVNNVTLTSLVLRPAAAPTISLQDQQQFTALASFSDNTQQDVTNVSSWTSTQPLVTSNSGLVIGQTVGLNTISAGFGSRSAHAYVTVGLSNLVSISISPTIPTMANHTTLQFAATGSFADGSTRDLTDVVSWSSSDGSVANFVSSVVGLVTSSSVGTTTITATVGSTTTTAVLNVSAAHLQSISVIPANASLGLGAKVDFTAIGVFSDGSTQNLDRQVLWSSSNPSSAGVSDTGSVTGLSAGSAIIGVTSYTLLGSVQGGTPVSVTAAALNSLQLQPANTFIPPGGSLKFSALGEFSDGTQQDMSEAVSWSSNLTTVATVKSAVAMGQGMGQALITSRAGTVRGTTQLSVASPQQISLAITPSTIQLAQQTSTQLSALGTVTGLGTQDLTTAVGWTSSSPTVASVGWNTGVVTGLAPGQSTITASLGSVSQTIQIKVTSASLTSITLSPENPSIGLGASQRFTATGHFSDGSSQTLLGASWVSANPTIAVVDGSGLATSVAAGVTTITVSLNAVSGSTALTVN